MTFVMMDAMDVGWALLVATTGTMDIWHAWTCGPRCRRIFIYWISISERETNFPSW